MHEERCHGFIYQCSIDTTHARIPKKCAMYSESIFTAPQGNSYFLLYWGNVNTPLSLLVKRTSSVASKPILCLILISISKIRKVTKMVNITGTTVRQNGNI